MKTYLLAAGSLLCAFALAPAASAQSPTDVNSAVISADTKGSSWTDEQFRNAKAKPLVELKKPVAQSKAPKPDEEMRSGQQPSLDIKDASLKGGPPIPLRWAGKVFFREGGGDWVCSGQFITSNIVLTAAHCAQDQASGQYVQDWVLALGYKDGDYISLHRARCLATFRGWTTGADENERYAYDYAMVLVDKPSPTGYFGYHYSWRNAYNKGTLIGYPADIAEGQRVQVVNAKIDPMPWNGVDIIKASHRAKDFQGGASGGAMVANYGNRAGKGTNMIIGNNSFGFNGKPYDMYSPYFTGSFGKLLAYVENGCR